MLVLDEETDADGAGAGADSASEPTPSTPLAMAAFTFAADGDAATKAAVGDEAFGRIGASFRFATTSGKTLGDTASDSILGPFSILPATMGDDNLSSSSGLRGFSSGGHQYQALPNQCLTQHDDDDLAE